MENNVNKEEEPTYVVKKIINHRKNLDNTYSYRVEWKGYASRFNEWVDEEDFQGKELIHKYWNPPKKRSRSRTESTTREKLKKSKSLPKRSEIHSETSKGVTTRSGRQSRSRKAH